MKRTIGSIQSRAFRLGFKTKIIGKCNRFFQWTIEEDNILKQYYPIGGYKVVLIHLPQRTKEGIQQRAAILSIKSNINSGNRWTNTEIELLKQYYPIEGINCYIRFSNRTKRAITRMANSLDLYYVNAIHTPKQILCIDTNEVFKSILEASKAYSSASSIRRCLQGKSKTAGGYHWKYIDN